MALRNLPLRVLKLVSVTRQTSSLVGSIFYEAAMELSMDSISFSLLLLSLISLFFIFLMVEPR